MSPALTTTLAEAVSPAIKTRDDSLEQTALLPQDTLTSLPLNVTLIPRTCGLLSDKELELTDNYDATSLLSMLASGEVTARQLLTAFRKRATIAQQTVRST